MIKKSILEKCDFNTPMLTCIDWYLWAQITLGDVYYINKKLTKWRRHKQSYINSADGPTIEFRLSILKFLVRKNKYLAFKYLKLYKSKIISIRFFKNPKISFLGLSYTKKEKSK